MLTRMGIRLLQIQLLVASTVRVMMQVVWSVKLITIL